MIKSFRHKGLKRLYEKDDRKSLNPDHVDRLSRILARLDVATNPQAMDLPGYYLHPMQGNWAGYWSVRVSGNWRVLFRFEDGNSCDLDYLDPH